MTLSTPRCDPAPKQQSTLVESNARPCARTVDAVTAPAGRDAAGLRVVYVINGLGPGGAEQSLAELLPLFQQAGIRPHVVCLKHRDIGVEGAVRALGCGVTFLPAGGWYTRVRGLRAVLRTNPADIIHSTLFEASVVSRLAALGTGIPVLTSLVNTNYEDAHRRDPNIRLLRLHGAQAIDAVTARYFTAHFHAISEAVKQSAIRSLGIPAERITVVFRGRTRERLGFPGVDRRRATRERLGIDDDETVILNVGRQEHQKGQRYLLEAAASLLPRHDRLRILIAGREGHATPELERMMARLGLAPRVVFLGYRTDVPDLLAAADIFVFPSLFEGLGGSALEAMAMGLPVVASDIPALREVVEDGSSGILVAPGSSDSLARALDRLVQDPGLRIRMGNRGMQLFDQKFTIERSAREMIALYERVIYDDAVQPSR